MPKTTLKSSPAVTTVNIAFSSKTPKRLRERISPEETQLKFDQVTLAPIDKSEPTILVCHSCNFKTKGSSRTHLEHHIKKFRQQCHLCSYSARKKGEFAYHLKNHHSNRPLTSKPLNIEQAAREHTKKRKYYNCNQCDYKSTDTSSVNWHIHKKHPISTNPSSTPSRKVRLSKLRRDGDKNEILPNFSPDFMTHRNNSATRKGPFPLYKCDLCEYETNKKSNLDQHCQYHLKKTAYQCNRCSYSVSMPNRLMYHLENHHSDLKQVGSDLGENHFPRHESKRVKRHHGNDESSTDEEKLKDLDSLLKCQECSFSTDSVAKLTFQEICHSSTCEHKSPLCSFSSSSRNVKFHLKNHHGDNAVCSLTKPEKVTFSVTSRDTNISPVKSPIKPRNFDGEKRSFLEEISLLEEALTSDRQALKSASSKLMNREEKMESLRAQVEIMKENVETTEKRLKDAQLHKIEEVKQRREAIKNKIQAEFDLRAAQCKTLELAFVALDAA